MSSNRPARPPRTPTLPQGETVAVYSTYLDAQKAVELLAEKQFPVTAVTIVGSDLRMVERVTGRLSYPRVASGGFLMGAWFGMFVGLLLTLFDTGSTTSPLVPSILLGGAFGLLMSVLTYAFTRGRRDFTTASQIVAASYTVLCAPEHAHKARNLLQGMGGVRAGWPQAAAAAPQPVAPVQPVVPGQPVVPPQRTGSSGDPDVPRDAGVSASDGAPGRAAEPGPSTPGADTSDRPTSDHPSDHPTSEPPTQPPAPPQS